jgi:hypothetical protein
MAKTVAPTMRTVFGRDLCERNGGSKHGVGKTLDRNEARSPPILSLVRIFPAANQNRGFEKAGGSEQESICFLFFPPEFWGKAPKSPYLQNSFLEIAKTKQSRIL